MTLNRFWQLAARQKPFGGVMAPTAQAVILAGQSNGHYVYTNAKTEYEAVLNSYWTSTTNALLDGAISGSTLLSSNASDSNFWYNDTSATFGAAWTNFAGKVAAYNGIIRAVHWDQGENDQGQIANNTAKQAVYKAGLVTVFTAMRTLIGEVPILISPIGRRGDTQTGTGYQVVRDIQKELANEYSWIFLLPEKINEADDGAAHLTAQGYKNYAVKAARKVLAVLGENIIGVNGPRMTSATRSGKIITATLAHDAGNDFTPLSTIEGFKFTDNGVDIPLTNIVRKDASHVAMTLSTKPTSGSQILYYGYDRMTNVDETKLVMDNAAVPMPLRTAKITNIPISEVFIDDVVPGAVYQHDARLNLYNGGQDIHNMVAFPNDGEMQAIYDGTLGTSNAVTSNDPGYLNGRWTFDGDDYNRVGGVTPTAFHAGLSTSKNFTFLCHFKTPSSLSGQPQIFSCGGTGVSIPGITLRYVAASNFMRIATANGTTTTTANMTTASQLNPNTVYKMAFSLNPVTGAYVLWLNGSTPVLTGTASLGGGTSTSAFGVFNQFTTGTELYGYGMYNNVLLNTQIENLFAYFDTL